MADGKHEAHKCLKPRPMIYCPSPVGSRGPFLEVPSSFLRTMLPEKKTPSVPPPPPPDNCPCNRNTKNILCQACGHTFIGRIRVVCQFHPSIIHLMDIDQCPSCQANHMKEFSDYVVKRD